MILKIETDTLNCLVRVSFTHELDSHNSFESADCGTFVSLPNGDELETGSMPRPDLPAAPVTEYEEVWRELPFEEGPEGPRKGVSWVLESDDGGVRESVEGEVEVKKTFLGRIWGVYLALRQGQTHVRRRDGTGNWVVKKTGGVVSARREEWSSESGWKERYVVGPEGDALPSMIHGLEGEGQGSWKVPGEKVVIQGRSFVVRAFEEIQ